MYVCGASAQGLRGRIPSRTDGSSAHDGNKKTHLDDVVSLPGVLDVWKVLRSVVWRQRAGFFNDAVSLSGLLGVWKVLRSVVWRQRAGLDEHRNRHSCHGAQCGGADSEPERGARRDRHCALRGKKTLQQILPARPGFRIIRARVIRRLNL